MAQLTPPQIALSRLARVDEQLFEAVSDLGEERSSRWVADTAPSIKWHLWHMARWADYVQSLIDPLIEKKRGRSELGPQLWAALGIDDDWGFSGRNLGLWGVGSTLASEESQDLPFPELRQIVAYARATFEALEMRVGVLDETAFNQPFTDWHDNETTLGDALIGYIAHANRHLGMIEALRGVLGMHGSVTV